MSRVRKARGREGVSRAFIGDRDLEEGVGFRARRGDRWLRRMPCERRNLGRRRKMT
jgi:hypothetical protein